MEQLSISGEILWQCNGIVSQVGNSHLSRVHRLDAPNKHFKWVGVQEIQQIGNDK